MVAKLYSSDMAQLKALAFEYVQLHQSTYKTTDAMEIVSEFVNFCDMPELPSVIK